MPAQYNNNNNNFLNIFRGRWQQRHRHNNRPPLVPNKQNVYKDDNEIDGPQQGQDHQPQPRQEPQGASLKLYTDTTKICIESPLELNLDLTICNNNRPVSFPEGIQQALIRYKRQPGIWKNNEKKNKEQWQKA